MKGLRSLYYNLSDSLNGPTAGRTMTTFQLPSKSISVLKGDIPSGGPGGGFVVFTSSIGGPVEPDGINLNLNYNDLVYVFEYEVVPLYYVDSFTVSFLTYIDSDDYDAERVYPMVDIDGEYTTYQSTSKGTADSTQQSTPDRVLKGKFSIEYYDQVYVHVSTPCSMSLCVSIIIPDARTEELVVDKKIIYRDCVPVLIKKRDSDGTIHSIVPRDYVSVAKKVHDEIVKMSIVYPPLPAIGPTVVGAPVGAQAAAVSLPPSKRYNNLLFNTPLLGGTFWLETNLYPERTYLAEEGLSGAQSYFGILLETSGNRSFHAVIHYYLLYTKTITATVTLTRDVGISYRYHTYDGRRLSQTSNGRGRLAEGSFVLQSDATAFALMIEGPLEAPISKDSYITVEYIEGRTP